MNKKTKLYGLVLLIIVVLIGWGIFFYYVPPETIVDKIGITNAYLVAFTLSLIGGFSSVTGTSLYAALAGLAQSGRVNTLVLGLVSGTGLYLSDTLFYLIANYGRNVIGKTASRWAKTFNKIKRWTQRAPNWLVYACVFIYSAFMPIPNDLMLAALAVSGYSYRQFALYLFLGDMVGTILFTYVVGAIR